MSREKQKILLFFLIAFSVYCALLVGVTWDEEFHIIQGKITLDYLLSFDKYIIEDNNRTAPNN